MRSVSDSKKSPTVGAHMARTAWYSVPPITHHPRTSSMEICPPTHSFTRPGWSISPGELPGISDILHVTVPSVRQDRNGWPRASSAAAGWVSNGRIGPGLTVHLGG